MKLIAVIPAYNEARVVADIIRTARSSVDSVIVVDDGSHDDTAIVARKAGAIVLRHWINRGQGAALRTGIDAALRLGADVMIHLDADGQHDPSCISALVDPIRRGDADVVFGSRFLSTYPDGMPRSRRMLLAAARTFNAIFMGIPRRVTDPQSGMRAFDQGAALLISFRQDKMAHCSEILRLVTRSSLRWIEVPIPIRYTNESLSKGQSSLDALKIVWQLFLSAVTK